MDYGASAVFHLERNGEGKGLIVRGVRAVTVRFDMNP